MAYVQGPRSSIESSASLVPCNLSLLNISSSPSEEDNVLFGVIHKHLVNISCLGSDKSTQGRVCYNGKFEDRDPSSYVTQARWCKLENSVVVLVLACYKGFQIMDQDGIRKIYFNKFETPPGSFTSRFTRGVASVGNSICIGTSEGTVLVLNVSKNGTGVELSRQLHGHSAAITDLATNTKGKLASADEQGTIILWKDPLVSTESSVIFSDSGGVPCSCVSFWNNFVIGGFSNGQLKLYNSESEIKVIEIAAHGRSITALDVATTAGLLLSASEDCTVSVWSLPTVENPKVELVHLEVVKDSLLCGARFIDPGGRRFALTAYDAYDIKTFIRKSS